jgi:hypothetical protein
LSLLTDFTLMSTLLAMNIAASMGFIFLENIFYFLMICKCLFFSVRWVYCKQYMVRSCFLTQFAVLHLLFGNWGHWFSVLVLRGAWCFQSFFPSVVSSTYSLLTGLLGQRGFFFHASSCLTLASSSLCNSPLSIFCSAGLVVMNFLSFSLLWKVLISPLIRKIVCWVG